MADNQDRVGQQTASPAGVAEASGKYRSLKSDVWRQFRRHKGAMAGMIILFVIALASFLGPVLWSGDGITPVPRSANLGPSVEHPMGTDNIGRDVMARVLLGGRISLAVGITAMLVSITVGTAVGVISGFFRRLDGPLMRITDLFLAMPILPLLLVVIMLFRNPMTERFGPELGIFIMVVSIIGATSWMQAARVVRSEVLAIKEEEFVIAAHSIGTRRRNVILRHILPNVLSPVMVAGALGVAVAIITESALSFLGLGFPSAFPTWGRLLFDAKDYLQLAPARVIWPGLMISLTVISVNFIGDGIRDALDPRLRSK
jgi:peptide/nickel transport system permease protein